MLRDTKTIKVQMKLEKIDIKTCSDEWNNYIKSNLISGSNNCFIAHNPSIAKIFENVFNYKSEYYYLIENGKIVGLFPGLRIKNKFVSLPIFPVAGIFSGTENNKMEIYKNINGILRKYEIRDSIKFSKYCYDKKVLSYLPLKESADLQWKMLKPVVRNRINKGYKNGIKIKSGGSELLDEFYDIYSINMHYLGSPVLDKKFFLELINNYKYGNAKIFIAYFENNPVGGSFTLSFNNLLEVNWASTLRKYNRYNPNMVLYWEMIKTSIENRIDFFSFGRSTKDSSVHKFKIKWGTIEIPIFFNYSNYTFDLRQLKMLSSFWQKLPLRLTTKIGPALRKLTKI